jgi:hypothetical protein
MYVRDRVLYCTEYRLYRPEMEIMAKYHQELIFISGMGMHVKNTVTVEGSSLFFKFPVRNTFCRIVSTKHELS